jgi:N-glycosidase YbiA
MKGFESGSSDVTIYFYSSTDDYGCFSNFSSHGFGLDGKYWPSSEHYFQAMKFKGTKHEEDVRKAKTPKEAARRGRDRKRPLSKKWESSKDQVMYRAVLKKFESHDDIARVLISTGAEKLVENAPGDYYWGCGANGTGKNRLGQILMKVREELKQRPSN